MKKTKRRAVDADGLDYATLAKSADPKRQTFTIHPRSIMVPGVDTPWDDADPQCDIRARHAQDEVAPDYDPAFVAGLRDGSIEPPPVVVLRDKAGRLVKLDGGRRIIHARKAGLASIEYVVAEGASPAAIFMAMKRANLGRVDDSALTQAKDADRARRVFGIPLPAYAPCTGLDTEVLRQRLSLLDLAPDLQARTELPESDEGYLPFSIGVQIAKPGKPKDRDKEAREDRDARWAAQRDAYERMRLAGNLTVAAARREKALAEVPPEPEPPGADEKPAKEPKERKGKALTKPHATGLSIAEVRKVVRRNRDGLPGYTRINEHTARVLAVVVGLAEPCTVAGMTEALNHLRGWNPDKDRLAPKRPPEKDKPGPRRPDRSRVKK